MTALSALRLGTPVRVTVSVGENTLLDGYFCTQVFKADSNLESIYGGDGLRGCSVAKPPSFTLEVMG
jgi:hypothetical protein